MQTELSVDFPCVYVESPTDSASCVSWLRVVLLLLRVRARLQQMIKKKKKNTDLLFKLWFLHQVLLCCLQRHLFARIAARAVNKCLFSWLVCFVLLCFPPFSCCDRHQLCVYIAQRHINIHFCGGKWVKFDIPEAPLPSPPACAQPGTSVDTEWCCGSSSTQALWWMPWTLQLQQIKEGYVFVRMTLGIGNMVLAVTQVSSLHCDSQCSSSLIGAVQLSGARGWMSNVMFHMDSQVGWGGMYLPLMTPESRLHHICALWYLRLFCPRRRPGETTHETGNSLPPHSSGLF